MLGKKLGRIDKNDTVYRMNTETHNSLELCLGKKLKCVVFSHYARNGNGGEVGIFIYAYSRQHAFPKQKKKKSIHRAEIDG